MGGENENLFPGIDLFKFIFAIVVVAIHADPLDRITLLLPLKTLYDLLCKSAVPFFFVATGFFIRYKALSEERLKGKLKAFVKIYFIALAAYLPFNLIVGWSDNPSMGQFILRYIKGIFIIGGGGGTQGIFGISCLYATRC